MIRLLCSMFGCDLLKEREAHALAESALRQSIEDLKALAEKRRIKLEAQAEKLEATRRSHGELAELLADERRERSAPWRMSRK